MYTFSIETDTGRHVGFLLIDNADCAGSGAAAIKVQAASVADERLPETAALRRLSSEDGTLVWRRDGEKLHLSGNGGESATLQAAYLSAGGFTFVLNDLQGVL